MALREILAEFGFKTDQKKLDAADKSIGGMIGKVKAATGAFAAFFAVGVIKSFVTEMTDAADHLAKTSAALGTNAEALQSWHFAAGLAGLQSEVLDVGLSKIQKKAYDAANGSTALAAAFKQLGVDVQDANGQLKSADVLFSESGEGISKLANKSEQTALAMLLFEEQGAKFVNFFSQGADGIAKARKEFDEFGGGFSNDFAKNAEAMNDNLARMDVAFLSIRSGLVNYFVPKISEAAIYIAKASLQVRKFLKETNAGKAILVVLAGAVIKFGAAAAAAGLKALLPWTPFIAAIGLAILLVDEIITTFQGGDTLIRRAIDGAFGKGTTAKIVASIKFWTGAIVEFFKNFDPRDFTKWIIEQLEAIAFAIDDRVNKAINSFIGWLDKLAPVIAGVAAMIMTVWLRANGAFVAGVARMGFATSAFTLKSIPAMIAALARQGVAMTMIAVRGAAQYVAGFARMAAAQLALLATNPFTWIVIGIGLAVAAIVWLWQNWDQVVADFKYALNDLGTWFGEVWDSIASGAGSAWDWVVDKVRSAVDAIKGYVLSIPGVDLALKGIGAIGDALGFNAPAPALDRGAGSRTTNNQSSQTNTVAPVINVDARGAGNPAGVRRAVQEASGSVAAATTRGFQNALVPKVI